MTNNKKTHKIACEFFLTKGYHYLTIKLLLADPVSVVTVTI